MKMVGRAASVCLALEFACSWSATGAADLCKHCLLALAGQQLVAHEHQEDIRVAGICSQGSKGRHATPGYGISDSVDGHAQVWDS